MTDLVNLGIGVSSKEVDQAARSLDRLSVSARNTQNSVSGIQGSANRANTATAQLAQTAGTADRIMMGLKSTLFQLGAAFISFQTASALIRGFVNNTAAAERTSAQLAAVLKSTGGAAGQTVEGLTRMASELQSITIYEDDVIASTEALLLTFREIKGDIFERATKSTLDLATALNKDLNSAALQVGKALQDPAVGLTALRRSGVSFSNAQKEVIQALFDTGREAEAQTMILNELERQFGGSAEAARRTLGGALASLSNEFGNLLEVSGPASDELRESIERLIDAITDPSFKQAANEIGSFVFDALRKAAEGAEFLAENLDGVGTAIKLVISYKVGSWAIAGSRAFFMYAAGVAAAEAAQIRFNRATGVGIGVRAATLLGAGIGSAAAVAGTVALGAAILEVYDAYERASTAADRYEAAQRLVDEAVRQSRSTAEAATDSIIELTNKQIEAADMLVERAKAAQEYFQTIKDSVPSLSVDYSQLEDRAAQTIEAQANLMAISRKAINESGQAARELYNFTLIGEEALLEAGNLFKMSADNFKLIQDASKGIERDPAGEFDHIGVVRNLTMQRQKEGEATRKTAADITEYNAKIREQQSLFERLRGDLEGADSGKTIEAFFGDVSQIDGAVEAIQSGTDKLLGYYEEIQKGASVGPQELARKVEEVRKDLVTKGLGEQAVDKFILAFTRGQSVIDTLINNIDILREKIQNIPDKTIRVTVEVTTVQRGSVSPEVQRLTAEELAGLPQEFAKGGFPPIGRAVLVGEQGPELVTFGEPARVTPSNETKRILSESKRINSGTDLNLSESYSSPAPGSVMSYASAPMMTEDKSMRNLERGIERTTSATEETNRILKEIKEAGDQRARGGGASQSGTIDLAKIFGSLGSGGSGGSGGGTGRNYSGGGRFGGKSTTYSFSDPRSPYHWRNNPMTGVPYDPVADYTFNGNRGALGIIAGTPINRMRETYGLAPGLGLGHGRGPSNADIAGMLQQAYGDQPQGKYGGGSTFSALPKLLGEVSQLFMQIISQSRSNWENLPFGGRGSSPIYMAYGGTVSGGKSGDDQEIRLFKNPKEVLGVFTPDQMKEMKKPRNFGDGAVEQNVVTTNDNSVSVGDVIINVPERPVVNDKPMSDYELEDLVNRAVRQAIGRV